MSEQTPSKTAPAPENSTGPGPLATLEQMAAEQLVLRVAGAPQIAAVKAALRTELLALPGGQTPYGAARLDDRAGFVAGRDGFGRLRWRACRPWERRKDANIHIVQCADFSRWR